MEMSKLQTLIDVLNKYELEQASPVSQETSAAKQETSPEKKEDDINDQYRKQKQFKYLKKYMNDPTNDKTRPSSGDFSNYYWNVDVTRYYGK